MMTFFSAGHRSLATVLTVLALGVTWTVPQSELAQCHAADGPNAAAVDDDADPALKLRSTRSDAEQDAANLRAAEDDIHERRSRIEEELAALPDSDLPADHWAREWAGAYYVGDGLGMNVSVFVAPTAGITYTWHGCLGLYDGNHGDLSEAFDLDGDGKPDGLRIDWELHPKSGFGFDSQEYYFVRWAGPDGEGGRWFLVPESRMMDVVNDYNQGGPARQMMSSAPRKYDHACEQSARQQWRGAEVVGVPQLPAKWAKLLHAKRVDAAVTQVAAVKTARVTDGVEATVARVTLDKGSADGLYLGLKARVDLPSGRVATLTINKLQEHTAEAAFRAFGRTGAVASPPAVGDVVRLIQGPDESETGE